MLPPIHGQQLLQVQLVLLGGREHRWPVCGDLVWIPLSRR